MRILLSVQAIHIVLLLSTNVTMAQQPAFDAAADEVYEKASPAVTMIELRHDKGEVVNTGSVFLVRSDRRLLTNVPSAGQAKQALDRLSNRVAYDETEVRNIDKSNGIALAKIWEIDLSSPPSGHLSGMAIDEASRAARPIFNGEDEVVVTAEGTFGETQNLRFAMLVDYPLRITNSTRSRPTAAIYEPNTDNRPSAAGSDARTSAAVEMKPNSLVYLESKLNRWYYTDAIKVLGEPSRHRDGIPQYPSDIYAFEDPTKLFRKVELDFDKKNAGALVNIYAYPWKMTWKECKVIWGDDVKTKKEPSGKKLYIYKNRRINVIVNSHGIVEIIGVY
jgi:hypothetical protein